MKIDPEGLSRINLMVEVYEIMAMPKKNFRGSNKPTRESLLVDTLIAKGFRQVDFSESKPIVVPLYKMEHEKLKAFPDGESEYQIINTKNGTIAQTIKLTFSDAIKLAILFDAQAIGLPVLETDEQGYISG